jgi:hypothetical protein
MIAKHRPAEMEQKRSPEMKTLSLKEKVDYMRIGMALVGISVNNLTAEIMVKMYEGITEKGGDFNLHDAVKIEFEVTGKYTKKEVTAEAL